MSLAKKIFRLTGGSILNGPFKGMRYIADSVGSSLGPKMLGTYELELHGVVLEIIASRPAWIVDVGAAEGYYAVGFARALPDCRITAFEADTKGIQMLRQLAGNNGVSSRIDLRGFCSRNDLENLLNGNPADYLILDVEGAEEELLGGPVPGLLKNTTLLVELHDFGTGKIRDPLVENFRQTHVIEEIQARSRTSSDIPGLFLRLVVMLLKKIGLDYLYERPPHMSWLVIKPKPSLS